MKINENSTVPLFAVIVATPAIVAGVLAFGAADAKAERALEAAQNNKTAIEKQWTAISEIKEIVIRIEERQKRGK